VNVLIAILKLERPKILLAAVWLVALTALGAGQLLAQDAAPVPDLPDLLPPPPAENPEEGLPAEEKPVISKTLAIVKDGESWYFDRFVTQIKEELDVLAEGHYKLNYREDFVAGDEAEKVEGLLKAALATDSIDVIYAAGVMATERAEGLADEVRKKPVVAGALQMTDTRGRPISKEGTSTVKNYTFITSPQRVSADIDLVKRLTGKSSIHVLIDARLMPELKDLKKASKVMEERHGVNLNFIAAGATAASALDKIPASVKAVYVAVLPRMVDGERKKLYAGLAKRGLPAVSMVGEEEVRESGAMAGLAPDNTRAVARRSALNVHQLLQGSSTESLPVYLPVQDHLMINASTAKATGWSPDYDTSLEAEFINEPTDGAKNLSLEEAMGLAANHNLDVLIAREEEIISRGDTAIARSNLFPQIGFNISNGRSGFSDKVDPLTTPDHAYQGTYGLELRQILFNDEVFSNLKALRQTQAAKHYDTKSQRYDVVEEAALAYFDLLTASALVDIEQENLRLTQNNLQLAKLRVDIGAAEPTELFRWQQNRDTGKATLIQRHSDEKNTQIALNRVLRKPLDTRWLTKDIQVGDNQFYFMDDYTREQIQTRKQLARFGAFLQFLAVENSPELFSFDHLLAGQGLILGQKQRRFYLPEVAATAGYDRVVSSADGSDLAGENQSSIGIQFSFPIGEGGRRKAELLQQKAVIRQLGAQRERAVQQIEQRALVAVNGIAAAHPNIRLSRSAFDAANKNYEAMQEKYAQGAASILDLLDAQSSLLQQKQQSSIASYSYLQQMFSLQRSVAWFEYDKGDADKELWVTLFKTFMRDGKIITRNGTYPRPPAVLAPTPVAAPPAVKPAPRPQSNPVPDSKPPKAVPVKKKKLFRLFKKRR
jgi:outer membrane protein